MTVSQQIILHMVQDNAQIREYEKAGVLSYKYFTTDYAYLQFVLNRYQETGGITLGELCIKYPDFPTDYVGSSQDSSYLVYQIKELFIYNELYTAINNGQQRFSNDGIQFLGYLEDTLKELRAVLPTHEEYDLIEHARDRYDKYLTTSNNQADAFIPTGFADVDRALGGWSKESELAVLFARMGMGKTWLLIYCTITAWKAGYRCGFLSVEMGANDIGYRIDTALSGISNGALRRGDAVDMNAYNNYLNMVKDKRGILLRGKKDFPNGLISPRTIKNWIQEQKLDIVFLDGISYIENERIGANNKNEASSITDVAEDLMSVSVDTHTPIILTAQANRSGADKTLNPGLETLRGSDGYAIHASFMASIAYPDDSHQILALEVQKARYGQLSGRMLYDWNPDLGYIQARGDSTTGGAFFGQR